MHLESSDKEACLFNVLDITKALGATALSATDEDNHIGFAYAHLLCDHGLLVQPNHSSTFRITGKGFDFLDLVRDQDCWDRAIRETERAIPKGSQIPFDILIQILRRNLMRLLNTDEYLVLRDIIQAVNRD